MSAKFIAAALLTALAATTAVTAQAQQQSRFMPSSPAWVQPTAPQVHVPQPAGCLHHPPVYTAGRVIPQPQPYSVPPVQPAILLGFNGNYNGWGIWVESVAWGSPAERIGLEVGDVVMAVNGQRIASHQHYLALLAQSGGYFTLTVRDVRTGLVMTVAESVGGYVPY